MKTLSGYIVLIVCFFGLLFLRHELRDYENIPFLSQDFRKSSLSERQMKERIALVEDEVDSLRSLLENDTKEPIAPQVPILPETPKVMLSPEAFKLDVFGAPTFLVNNKLFWGQDRLEYAIDESKN